MAVATRENTEIQMAKPSPIEKSFRTLAFFKNTGLMIRMEPVKQFVYISFLKKRGEHKYQPFADGFVVKLDLGAVNEMLYCLTGEPGIQWETWREKETQKYSIRVAPMPLQEFELLTGTPVKAAAAALKLTVYDPQRKEHSFILLLEFRQT